MVNQFDILNGALAYLEQEHEETLPSEARDLLIALLGNEPTTVQSQVVLHNGALITAQPIAISLLLYYINCASNPENKYSKPVIVGGTGG